MLRLSVLTACAIGLVASTSSAATIYGTAAPLSGTIGGAGLITTGSYAGDDVSIEWDITDNGDGTYDYSYTFVDFRSPAISHVVLDLTDDAVFPSVDPDAVTDPLYNGSTGATLEFGEETTSPSNPGFPAGFSIVGVKFDETPEPPGGMDLIISFTSNRAPVYGDVYVKGGSDGGVYNVGLTDHSLMDPLAFIARPNGSNGVIPEPSTLALCGISTLAGLGIALRRQRRRA